MTITTATKALRTAFGSAIAVAALAAVLTGCNGSGYAAGEPTGDDISSFGDSGFDSSEFDSEFGSDFDPESDPEFGTDSGFSSDPGFGSDSDSDSDFSSDSGSVVFGSDGDSLTTLPGGDISFSGSDGSSFSTG